MSYTLGSRSNTNLVGVDPRLVAVVRRAIETTTQDFTVIEGVRTLERQKRLLAAGKTKTLNSYHIVGKAVDLGAWSNGKIDWDDSSKYVAIAEAMRKAAIELGHKITWGSAWISPLNDFNSAAEANAEYLSYKRRIGSRPFLDSVHFQLEN